MSLQKVDQLTAHLTSLTFLLSLYKNWHKTGTIGLSVDYRRQCAVERENMSNTTERWIKAEKGIRYREHPTRKHGIQRDRYYVLRFAMDGKICQEALGWASEGITLEKARIELAKLREARRTGIGLRSLSEKRAIGEEQRRLEEEAALVQYRAQITLTRFWDEVYWPAQIHKAPGSRVAESAIWRKWIQPRIGDISLISLTSANLEPIKADMMLAGKAPSSIKYAMALISQIWTLALRDDIVSGNSPTKRVALPKKDNRRQRYLTVDEAQKLLHHLQKRSPIMHDMAIMALDCGLRFGEIAALTWKDCDFDRGLLHIRDPKARVNRTAFMTDRVRGTLQARKSLSIEEVVFQYADKAMDSVHKSFKNVANELFNQNVMDNRHRVCFHTLRHTFASRLVENGIDLYRVKELMGHSSIKMTERYSHLSPKQFKDAIDVLNKI
jgi:integrase